MIRLTNIKMLVGEDESVLYKKISKLLRGKKVTANQVKIHKKSLDARDKNNIFYLYTVDVDEQGFKPYKPIEERTTTNKKIIVVGSGPCGLFCALYLARRGYNPIIFERGADVEKRKKITENFVKTRVLDENTNIQFGEGGAGTFSDGKLNTQINDERIISVLNDFVYYGAPEEILYLNKAHIGSDLLPKTIKNLREDIIRLGGKFYFETAVKDFNVKNGKITSVVTDKGVFDCDDVVLAIGHSARDTFRTLYDKGVVMSSKDFAVGLRIEHLRESIDKSQYGEKFGLKSADYKLVSHLSSRGVFTFCMCPGGYVMPATSVYQGVVTNGMSLYGRDNINSNSAVIAQVGKQDYGTGVFDGIRFQEELEKKAYLLGGGDYVAPVQRVEDFIKGESGKKSTVIEPTYPLGYNYCDLNKLFTDSVSNALKTGITDMDKRLKGFARDGVLTGVESRTSSPVRIERNSDFTSVSVSNLYPSGEGAGYAGGIMSASVDGIKTAYAIMNKYEKENL